MQIGETTQAEEVEALVNAVRPLFAGKPTGIQGAALADLLAIWLAGHVIRDDPAATERIRADVLEAHLIAVRALVPVNYAGLIEPELARRREWRRH